MHSHALLLSSYIQIKVINIFSSKQVSCKYIEYTAGTHTHTHRHTFTVPWQEPWAGHIDSGSWESIGPAGVKVKGPVTHQPCSGEQTCELCPRPTRFVFSFLLRTGAHQWQGAWCQKSPSTRFCSCSTSPSQAPGN